VYIYIYIYIGRARERNLGEAIYEIELKLVISCCNIVTQVSGIYEYSYMIMLLISTTKTGIAMQRS